MSNESPIVIAGLDAEFHPDGTVTFGYTAINFETLEATYKRAKATKEKADEPNQATNGI
jgi:hypothetical protein